LYLIGIGNKNYVFSARIKDGPRVALKLYEHEGEPNNNPFENERRILQHLQGMNGVQQLYYCGLDDNSEYWGLITLPVGLSLELG